MAGNLEGEIVSDDVKFGFQRPEMYELKLKGTASVYDRHVFLCYKSHEVWPSHLESSDSDPLPKLFAATLKARKDDIKLKTILTICEVREDIGLSDGDVLIFPDMIKYRNLKESDVDAFVEDVLVSGKPWTSGPQEPINGSYVFVCSHNNRDRRCGVCGPILIEEFSKAIESKDLKNEVHVAACSHVGGHKYAGNVIIYGTDKQGKIAGHWYGYVTPDEVPILLDEHIGEGKILERLCSYDYFFGTYTIASQLLKSTKNSFVEMLYDTIVKVTGPTHLFDYYNVKVIFARVTNIPKSQFPLSCRTSGHHLYYSCL